MIFQSRVKRQRIEPTNPVSVNFTSDRGRVRTFRKVKFLMTFTDKAPAFHIRLLRALMASADKAAIKKAAEVRATGRVKGWND